MFSARTPVTLFAAALGLGALLTGCSGAAPAAETERSAAFVQELHDLLPAEIQKSGTVRVASSDSYPPFEMRDTDGKTLIGADPDLAAAMGEVLGVEFALQPIAFDSMITGIAAGRYDIAMGGMADTAERQEVVTFVDYMANSEAIVAPKGAAGAPTTIEEMCGMKVAAQLATTMATSLEAQSERCVADGEAAIELSLFKNQEEALLAMRSDRVEVLVLTAGSAGYLAKTADEVEITGTYGAVTLGIAVTKDSEELVAAIRGALTELERTGSYEEILGQWGLFDHNSLTEFTVNLAAK